MAMRRSPRQSSANCWTPSALSGGCHEARVGRFVLGRGDGGGCGVRAGCGRGEPAGEGDEAMTDECGECAGRLREIFRLEKELRDEWKRAERAEAENAVLETRLAAAEEQLALLRDEIKHREVLAQ